MIKGCGCAFLFPFLCTRMSRNAWLIRLEVGLLHCFNVIWLFHNHLDINMNCHFNNLCNKLTNGPLIRSGNVLECVKEKVSGCGFDHIHWLLITSYDRLQESVKKPRTSNGVSKPSMMPPTMSSPSVLIPIPWYTQSTLSSREQSTYSASHLADTLTAT